MKGEVENGEDARNICRDALLERLLSIYQFIERQAFWNIIKNTFAENTNGPVSLFYLDAFVIA